jgi:anti-sigma factor RsiW
MTDDVEKLSCQELVELVTDYLDGVLTDEERRRFDEHLSGCDGCRTYLEQMRTTIQLSGALSPREISPEAERALLEAFRGWKTV